MSFNMSTIRDERAKEDDVLHPLRPVDEHRAITRAETQDFKATGAGARGLSPTRRTDVSGVHGAVRQLALSCGGAHEARGVMDRINPIRDEHQKVDAVLNNTVDRHRELARLETRNFSPSRRA